MPVTGGSERNYASAEKLFEIPDVLLAVMHSGNVQLAGVPWQILIECWGKTWDRVERASMADYAEGFLSWPVVQDQYAGRADRDRAPGWLFRDYMLFVRSRIRRTLKEMQIQLGLR